MIRTFEQINNIAKNIAIDLKNKKYSCLALIGDLGTGKTHITKIIAKELGILEHIKSPTFNYVNTYSDEEFSHFDIYRLSSEDELYDIGFEDYLDGRTLIIEWADKVLEALPKDTLYVEIKHNTEDTRDIVIYEKGDKNDICYKYYE